jgi:hypothetical protein
MTAVYTLELCSVSPILGTRCCRTRAIFQPIRERKCCYSDGASRSTGNPSVETSRRTGESADSLDAHAEGGEDMRDAVLGHIFGQSSIGNGASNIEGGIIALNCSTAAFVLNSGQAYSGLHWRHRFTITARPL